MNNITDFTKALQEVAPEINILKNENLSKHTVSGTGGTVAVFAQPKTEDELRILLGLCEKYRITPSILGAGSKIIGSEDALDSIVICTRGSLGGVERDGVRGLRVGAGVSLKYLSFFACAAGLSGLEFACALSGTVGAASKYNPRIGASCIGDVQRKTRVVDYQ